MKRRLLPLVVASLLFSGSASAVTNGFACTFEEFGFRYPAFDTALFSDFPAPVGTFEILTPGNVKISTNDPVFGPLPCDPTTSKALVGDTSLGTVEMRFALLK